MNWNKWTVIVSRLESESGVSKDWHVYQDMEK